MACARVAYPSIVHQYIQPLLLCKKRLGSRFDARQIAEINGEQLKAASAVGRALLQLCYRFFAL
jgi:hypothetical protein